MIPPPKGPAISDLKKDPTQVENDVLQFLVCLTELLSNFLSTRWVLPTLTQNYAARRKEIKYTWMSGMKVLMKSPLTARFPGPFPHSLVFTPKEVPWDYCRAELCGWEAVGFPPAGGLLHSNALSVNWKATIYQDFTLSIQATGL